MSLNKNLTNKGMSVWKSIEVLKNLIYNGVDENKPLLENAFKTFEYFWPIQQEVFYGKDLTYKLREFKNIK